MEVVEPSILSQGENQMNIKIIFSAIAAFGVIALSSLPGSASDAVLKANSANARINLRSTPSVTASSRGFGLPGNRVRIIDQRIGTNGNRWYYVQFYRSGAEGWIDGTYVQPMESLGVGGPSFREGTTVTSRANRLLINNYEVRIFSRGGQTRLNVFDRRTNQTKLNAVPVTVRRTSEGVIYEGRNVELFLHDNNGEKTITFY